jgi:hypothetical protein
VDFAGNYTYVHDDAREGFVDVTWRFPTTSAIYDRFRFEVNGVMDPSIVPQDGDGAKVVRVSVPVREGTRVPFTIAYASRGLEEWRYSFGKDVNRVKNFDLTLTTDFRTIDYPAGTISPQSVEPAGEGFKLRWASENLISGFAIGMEMPHRINPGPLAAEMTFFAPVSLFFFFVWMFVITLMKEIELHPMNYLFLGAAFFAFHLLFAYSVDHIDLVPAFLIASAVSVALVASYLRLVVRRRRGGGQPGGLSGLFLLGALRRGIHGPDRDDRRHPHPLRADAADRADPVERGRDFVGPLYSRLPRCASPVTRSSARSAPAPPGKESAWSTPAPCGCSASRGPRGSSSAASEKGRPRPESPPASRPTPTGRWFSPGSAPSTTAGTARTWRRSSGSPATS